MRICKKKKKGTATWNRFKRSGRWVGKQNSSSKMGFRRKLRQSFIAQTMQWLWEDSQPGSQSSTYLCQEEGPQPWEHFSAEKRHSKKPFKRNTLIYDKTSQQNLPQGLSKNTRRNTSLRRLPGPTEASWDWWTEHSTPKMCLSQKWSVNILVGCFWGTWCRHTDLLRLGLTWG